MVSTAAHARRVQLDDMTTIPAQVPRVLLVQKGGTQTAMAQRTVVEYAALARLLPRDQQTALPVYLGNRTTTQMHQLLALIVLVGDTPTSQEQPTVAQYAEQRVDQAHTLPLASVRNAPHPALCLRTALRAEQHLYAQQGLSVLRVAAAAHDRPRR